MKQLFLTSSAEIVLADIAKHLPLKPSKYNFAFINTAAEPEEGEHIWVTDDKNKMIELGFNVEEFSITGMNSLELENKLKDKNGIFMCGGNTFHLLDQIIKTGFDTILLNKIEKGTIYIGSSAGSIVLGNYVNFAFDDKSSYQDLKSIGLGIIDIAIKPHWGSDLSKESYLKNFDILYNTSAKLILLRDNQYVYFNGDNYVINQVN